MKNQNIGRWVALFLAFLIVPFVIFVIIPLVLGFPKHFFPFLAALGFYVSAFLYKKFLGYKE